MAFYYYLINRNLSNLQQEEDASSRMIVDLTNTRLEGSDKIKMICILLLYINKVYIIYENRNEKHSIYGGA